LIDNALDARATSIAVEIYANTVDSIQVRDNGHGIPPQDRPLVARRYCTSKLTNAEDLASIGGSSLGFRGEALASAAEMSGGMTVTTRVEGEQVATALKIDHRSGARINGSRDYSKDHRLHQIEPCAQTGRPQTYRPNSQANQKPLAVICICTATCALLIEGVEGEE
jgi:DNA topoisomerase VI subunit B